MLMRIKKIANKFGYDIKHYHSFHESVIKANNIKTILDIGANTGQFATEVYSHLPDAQVYSFEPLKDCYETLVKNLSSHKNFKAYNVGLGETEETLEFNRSSFSPSSSLLKMADLHKKLYPKSKEILKEHIIVKRLDNISDLHIEKNLLMKIDVQGYENKVIMGGKNIIAQAKLLLIETSFVTLYEHQPLFDDIYELVKSLGFSYYGNHGQHFDLKTKALLYEDSVFINNKIK